jgi:uncharacterized membrane protein YfcA
LFIRNAEFLKKYLILKLIFAKIFLKANIILLKFIKIMFFTTLIAIFFSIGFFFESIFGFGGGLISFALLGFFLEIKEMILVGLYIGTLSSSYIAFTSRKHFEVKIFVKLIPLALLGSIIGVYGFMYFSAEKLSLIFAIILFFLAIKMIFFDHYKFPKLLKNKFLLIGAISQGAFGIGGPFIVSVVKNDFKSKSSLRATMAVYFVFCNVLRIIQMFFADKLKIEFFAEIAWTIIPVFIAIYFGHLVHLKIKDDVFKKGVSIMILLASINFMFKALK